MTKQEKTEMTTFKEKMVEYIGKCECMGLELDNALCTIQEILDVPDLKVGDLTRLGAQLDRIRQTVRDYDVPPEDIWLRKEYK